MIALGTKEQMAARQMTPPEPMVNYRPKRYTARVKFVCRDCEWVEFTTNWWRLDATRHDKQCNSNRWSCV